METPNETKTRRVTLAFNTTAENAHLVASFGMNYLWFDCLNDGYPDGLVNSLMVHGPLGDGESSGKRPDKIFMTVETANLPLLEAVIKQHIDISFEVREPVL